MTAAYYHGLYMSSNPKDAREIPGGMMAVGMTETKAVEELQPCIERLTIAAVNSPRMVTISGDKDAIVALKASLAERNIFARQLQVAQAFHSHHMMPLAAAYLDLNPHFDHARALLHKHLPVALTQRGPCREITKALKLEIPYVASLTRGVPDFDCVLGLPHPSAPEREPSPSVEDLDARLAIARKKLELQELEAKLTQPAVATAAPRSSD